MPSSDPGNRSDCTVFPIIEEKVFVQFHNIMNNISNLCYLRTYLPGKKMWVVICMTELFIRYGIIWKRQIKHDYLLFFVVQKKHEIKEWSGNFKATEWTNTFFFFFPFSQCIIKLHNLLPQKFLGSIKWSRKFIQKTPQIYCS